MRLLLLPAIVFIVVSILVDIYIYKVLRERLRHRLPACVHLWAAVALQLMIVSTLFLPRRNGDNGMLLVVMWMLYTYLSVYIPKFIFVVIDMISRIPRLFHRKRAAWLSVTGAVLAFVLFIVMWWGALVNRYSIDVKEVDVTMASLPDSFDGLRVAQISDLHVGTFGRDTSFVSRLVDKVNSLNPDVIVFTGDIVNSRTSELLPHIGPLSRLSAPMGVYSILGNHDYGDYSDWPDENAKIENRLTLVGLQKEMGWRLLLNETEYLRIAGDSLALIGVENIGDPPFKVYGSLKKAYPDISDPVCKILLTHNPVHWTDSISGRDSMNVALTLSGHTHAMQIEVGGWSPAVWRYRTWGGMYCDEDSTHHLYVNIGDGTVGFPARIGATPEITILTLKKGK